MTLTNISLIQQNITLDRNEELYKYIYLFCTVLFCPAIVTGNILVIFSFIYSRRVRSPSNQLILYLALLDFQFGLAMALPFILKDTNISIGIELELSLLTLLFMVSIALDKALSLGKAFMYYNFVTWTNIHMYSFLLLLLSSSFSIYIMTNAPSFSKTLRITILSCLLLPCLLITFGAYIYIYVIATRHVRAIRRVQISVHSKAHRDHFVLRSIHQQTVDSIHNNAIRNNPIVPLKNQTSCSYGKTLFITVIAVLASQLPIPFTVFAAGQPWAWAHHLLNLPMYICSAFNPWIYAYHNLEIKLVMIKLVQKMGKLHLFFSCTESKKSQRKNRQRKVKVDKRSLSNLTVGITQVPKPNPSIKMKKMKLHHQSMHLAYSQNNNLCISI